MTRILRFLLLATLVVAPALALPAAGPANGTYQLLVSAAPDRSGAVPLEGHIASEGIYVYTNTPTAGIRRVLFYIDDPNGTGTPYRIEAGAPHDLAGSLDDGTAKPYQTANLSNGDHTITAVIEPTSGAKTTLTSTFTVSNRYALDVSSSPSRSNPHALDGATVAGDVYVFSSPATGIKEVRFYLDDPVRSGLPKLIERGAPFDFRGTEADGSARPFDTRELGNGTHTITAEMIKINGLKEVATSTFKILNKQLCDPLPCSAAKVDLPFDLSFNEDRGKIADGSGVGTGFTWIDHPRSGTGYKPELLALDTVQGALDVTTTPGIAFEKLNTQDNALGAGFAAPNQITRIRTTISNPPQGSGGFEQAGLYFGNDQDNHVKLMIQSTPDGTRLQQHVEVKGAKAAQKNTPALDVTGTDVTLTLIADPLNRTVTGSYQINGGVSKSLGPSPAPGEFFSFDGAGIDPEIGTRSFAGILATHRNGTAPLTYRFEGFSITDAGSVAPETDSGDINFDRVSFPLSNPTSMDFGPDGRLYVSEMFGRIHALTLGPDHKPVADQVITTLGSRLTLGVEVDPSSTPDNVVLWATHSSPSLDAGVPNSGTVTRLSGPEFTTREDVITGLPRAQANHGLNSLHFGPDGKLYIAAGGNTGAGAPNNGNSEFGTMQEQPLSAALLVADVRAPGFDGSCANTQNIFGPPPCDVVPYATGLRNMYDFVFHTNGSAYGANNGLGVVGTFPPSPTPPCTGFGNPAPWDEGGHNPGEQADSLHRLEAGRYYGHPNPYRDECVFDDGHYQGTSPPPNYTPPLQNLGEHRSANGMVEYRSGAFCGDLRGDLLISNYSVGDNLSRTQFSDDGLGVLASGSLIGGFNDPLPVAEGPDGAVFVGEFGGGKVTALVPIDLGCWDTEEPAPSAVLDAGGAALGGKLYVVAGKTSSGHRRSVDVYDPATGAWSAAAPLPGPGVENPAVVAHDGKLYAFGGSTAPFSGAVTNAAVYDPAAGAWTSLAPMAIGRTGAAALALGGKIYVIGGMDENGSSLASMEVYDVASNSWSDGTPLGTRRDNPGAAVLDGKLYVFGGRIRNADGSTDDPTLASVERYDPVGGEWLARAPMPTGRRTMVVGRIGDRAQLIGGEVTASGGAFAVVEEYDEVTNTWRRLRAMPTPRHGAAGGTIDGSIHVVGGGPTSGLTFTDAHEAFAFQG